MPLDNAGYDFDDRLLRLLSKARDLISTPQRWIRGTLMRHNRFCAVGAVYQAAGLARGHSFAQPTPLAMKAVGELERALPLFVGGTKNSGVPIFNDSHTHRDVMALFERAMAKRRAELMEKYNAV